MSKMPIAEQHRIVHELVERYKLYTQGIYSYNKIFDNFTLSINLLDSDIDLLNNEFFFLSINAGWTSQRGVVQLLGKSIQELQETCFQDLLNPTENEITLFELTYGFKWPLQLFAAMP